MPVTAVVPQIRSLASGLAQAAGTPFKSAAMLVPLAQDGRPLGQGGRTDYLRFQHFPSEITSSKAPNMALKDIPGLNLPLHQWTSGGEHTISFTTTFSCDVDLLELGAPLGETVQQVLQRRGLAGDNVDIRAAIAWLRQYTLASYMDSQGALRTVPPPPVLLSIPNSGIGLMGGLGGVAGSADAMIGHMKTADPTISAYFPSGLPRVATVQVTITETAQLGGVIRTPHAGPLARIVSGATTEASYGYNLRASGRPIRR